MTVARISPLTTSTLFDKDRETWERERLAILHSLGVTPAEASLFSVLQYGLTVPPSDLVRRAADECYSVGPTTPALCEAALVACFAKGWLQVIDELALNTILDYVRDNQLIGPIYSLPDLDGVEFTLAGAELWDQYCRLVPRRHTPPPFAYHGIVHERNAHYYATHEAAVSAMETARRDDYVVAISEPLPLGPWRAQWWRRFSGGYRVDIERQHQWPFGVGSGESCSLQLGPRANDQENLRRVLAQHQVTFAQWLILATLEDGPRRPFDAAYPGRRSFYSERGVSTLSERECQTTLETCLQRGWVQVLDLDIIAAVQAMVGSDTALLALPKMANYLPGTCRMFGDPARPGEIQYAPLSSDAYAGDIDFTPAGAALYRMLSAAWLGSDWENCLHVSRGYYREEHAYCESEAGFVGLVEERIALGSTVRAKRLEEIGPWCVRWWEHFTRGYRMELELVEPSFGDAASDLKWSGHT